MFKDVKKQMSKFYPLVLAIPLLMFACAAPTPELRENISATAISSPPVPTTVSTSIVSTQPAPAKLIPKHTDLIFVEFFAAT